MLALFISEAGDTILHPDFIGRVKELLPETSKGIEVIKIAEKSYPSFPHHAERLERHWGGTIWLTVEDDKKKLIDLLRAYAENGDSGFRMHKTGVSHLEVVKQAITLAMEKPDLEANVLRLLKEANEKLLVSSSQVFKGFSRVQESLDDLSLEIPSAKAIFNSLRKRFLKNGLMPPSFHQHLPLERSQTSGT
ncbi:MA3 domain-containing protein [Rhynchospora pubera]|uniref:MA3 domain-containing protein n=1 Tax=Rhynchospora pubera TaxID=906938 RepID=A0AAV8EG56_9POAL|nr:MA3 domain-containing protein [Rhynchospora pubera]